MSDGPESQKIDDLAARIQKAQGVPSGEAGGPPPAKSGGNAGYELGGTIIGCLLIGWLIDRYAHVAPWGILGMLLIGIVAGFVNVWRALNGYDRSIGLHKRDEE